ncbi:hypothetical protein CEXT_786211 [Caerostris extrusa]|uniref:Uncharacterized protein n=1 Tax=Caerostris extrusa TaxID=172846 RepID=A0AAV4RDX5_CAEEX|nr:hypothetical protein CEXT_786211 [Caerostris extrusa]
MTEQDDQDRANFQNMIDSYLSTRDSKSPPKAQVDEASLQQAMDKNKESLKVKLMMRRPINLLVEQGIMPSPKKPLQYLQQCQKLERAQTENILKHLMKTRPDRQALIDHHILEVAMRSSKMVAYPDQVMLINAGHNFCNDTL